MDIRVNKTPLGTREYPMHAHKGYEIMHYIRGSGVMRTERGDIPFCEGTVIVMPPSVLHGSASEGEFVNISVECDFSGLLLFDKPIVLTDCDKDEGAELINIIWESRYKPEPYLGALCTAYAHYILQKVEVDREVSLCVKNIVKCICDSALDSETDVGEILRRSGYAEDYVRACFKRETGKSPLAYLTELRIKHARYLIEVYKDSLSLSEIAEACGYTDYVYFSKRFKALVGVSPRKYRSAV